MAAMCNSEHTVAEIGCLVGTFFRAVSFEIGGRPAYDDIRDLFIDNGLLIKNSGPEPEVLSVDDFIAPRRRLVDSGELTTFLETESSHLDEVFGNVAHRLSVYAKSGVSAGVAFQVRGVISTQFILTRDGWRMTSMAWDDERSGLTVPEHHGTGVAAPTDRDR